MPLLMQQMFDDKVFPGLIAEAIRLYREESGMSQQQLATKVGLKQSAIARLESGRHTAKISTINRVLGGVGAEMALHIHPNRVGSVSNHTAAELRAFYKENLKPKA